jgi:hypothetical protein
METANFGNQDRYIRNRRSRHDMNGRDFKCQICDKTYLSYPAMYQHMKNKHSLDPNAQQTFNAVNSISGGKRGRPRKDLGFTSIDPTSDIYLSSEGRQGGPVDPITHFQKVFDEVFVQMNDVKYSGQYSKHPLYESLARFAFGKTPGPSRDLVESGKRESEQQKKVSESIN